MYIHFVAKQYSIAEARSSLPSIVDQAEAGEEIERVELTLSEVRRMLDERQFHDSKTIIGLRELLAWLEREKA